MLKPSPKVTVRNMACARGPNENRSAGTSIYDQSSATSEGLYAAAAPKQVALFNTVRLV